MVSLKKFHIMIKKEKILLSVTAALSSLFLAFIAGFAYYSIYSLENKPAVYKHQLYRLKSGYTSTAVLEDFVKNPFERFVDRIYLHFHDEYNSIQKGDYLVDGKKTLIDIYKDMVTGNVVEKIYPTFAIVEGTNLQRIIEKAKLRKHSDKSFFKNVKKPQDYMSAILAEKPELLEFIGGPQKTLEGLISPATYPMYENDPFSHMFKRGMIRQLRYLKQEWENRDENKFIKTPYEALILASLIEKETFLDEERSKVSAVFLNRLKKNMRLQTDPSVMYGVSPVFSGKLTKNHLKADSPYNTYSRYGLPPTPICMPSEKSIKAALHPANIEALYFVAKDVSPKQGHAFTATLQDHNKAVSDYRKKVRAYKERIAKSIDENGDKIITDRDDGIASLNDTADKAETLASGNTDTK